MTKKLNLGCGEFKKKGYVNVDYYSISEPDIKHNLNDFPYPFSADEFDLIESSHLLEHLDNPFMVMKELHRITKPNGLIVIKVPHFSRGFTHPEHKRGFDVTFPHYFNPAFKGGYQGFQLKLTKMKLSWFAQRKFKKTVLGKTFFYPALFIGTVLDFFANLSPFLCSRLWCYSVGGFEEISYQFVVKK